MEILDNWPSIPGRLTVRISLASPVVLAQSYSLCGVSQPNEITLSNIVDISSSSFSYVNKVFCFFMWGAGGGGSLHI